MMKSADRRSAAVQSLSATPSPSMISTFTSSPRSAAAAGTLASSFAWRAALCASL